MMRALTTAGTGMVAQQFNLDTIANNLANVNTTAFKEQRAEFEDLVYQTLGASGAGTAGDARQAVPIQVGLGARFSATSVNGNVGAPINTGNPLEMMVNGAGYFQIESPSTGETLYTRDGNFKVDGDGNIVTSMGFKVSPNITVPAGTTALTVSQSGIVSGVQPGQNEVTQLGQITVAVFPNPAGLTRIGNNLMQGGGSSGEPQVVTPGEQGSGFIQSGFIEGSNVQIVEEMVRMITAQRAYEINSKAVQTADEMLGTLNQLKR
ncbi:MAG: flagellar basal-body rod protein FlgG [Fimbriimonadaceae bacterium]|nr:flagellar basal-body rod protein FlgG [Fimbriimonadaceae bacterium]